MGVLDLVRMTCSIFAVKTAETKLTNLRKKKRRKQCGVGGYKLCYPPLSWKSQNFYPQPTKGNAKDFDVRVNRYYTQLAELIEKSGIGEVELSDASQLLNDIFEL